MNSGRNDSISVELRLFAMFREAVGQKTLAWTYHDRATVSDVLSDLEAEYPALSGALLDDSGDVRPTVAVVLNGRNVVHLDEVDTRLADDDTVAVMRPVAGGVG